MKPGNLLVGAAVIGASVLLFMSASSEYLRSTSGMPVFSGLGGVAQNIAEDLGAASTSDRRGVLQLAIMASMVGMVGGAILVVAQLLPAQEATKGGKGGKGGKRGKGESDEDEPRGGKRRAGGAARGGRKGSAGRRGKVGVTWKGRG